MTNLKKTRRALLGSVLALILCFAMLLGSTWAWFTDSATTNVAVIKTGNLSIDLLQYVDGTNDIDLTATDLAFDFDANQTIATDDGGNLLWEPGATWYTNEFYIKNTGDFAVKYQINVANTNTDVGADGEDLFEVTLMKVDTDGTSKTYTSVNGEGTLTSGDSSNKYVIAVTMNPTAGNDFNAANANATETEFERIISVQVLATQASVEFDANDPSYDTNATYATETTTAPNNP